MPAIPRRDLSMVEPDRECPVMASRLPLVAHRKIAHLLGHMMENKPPRVSMIASFLVVLLITACSGEATSPTTIPPAPTSSVTLAETTTTMVDTTTTTGAPSTTSPAAEQTLAVALYPFSEMGPGWTEQVFPYGEGEGSLGTEPGGEGLMFGPDYGTQSPDASWWFLDAAKKRIAHFGGDGDYLDQVLMPQDLLVDGIYFQYQLPQALDDGSIVAIGWRAGETTSLLQIENGEASAVTFDGAVAWVTTDGAYLYGHDVEGTTPHRLDPNDPFGEPVDWFRARDGSRYMVTLNEDEILVELPDAAIPLSRTLRMRYSEDPDVIARGAIQVETGADGTLFILMYGVPMTGDPLDIGGLVTITPNGVVSEVAQVTNLFSTSDTGSPAHLGVTPGSSNPWLMVVGEDGVHVFRKTG
jgi:hypothetical protein